MNIRIISTWIGSDTCHKVSAVIIITDREEFYHPKALVPSLLQDRQSRTLCRGHSQGDFPARPSLANTDGRTRCHWKLKALRLWMSPSLRSFSVPIFCSIRDLSKRIKGK